MYKIETYLPPEALDQIRDAVGPYSVVGSDKYSHCMSWYKTQSMWKPAVDANPYLGTPGELQYADEVVLTLRCREEDLDKVVELIRENHPYEEPAIDVVKLL